MAIALVGSRTFHDGGSTADVHSFSFTVGSGASILVVKVNWEDAATVAEIRWGGSTGALLTEAAFRRSNSGNRCAGIYYLVDPANGTQDIWLDFSQTVSIGVEALALSGVDTVAPIADASTGQINGAALQTEAALVPDGANCWLETTLCVGNATSAVAPQGLASETNDVQVSGGIAGFRSAHSAQADISANVQPGWDCSPGSVLSLAAVLLKAAEPFIAITLTLEAVAQRQDLIEISSLDSVAQLQQTIQATIDSAGSVLRSVQTTLDAAARRKMTVDTSVTAVAQAIRDAQATIGAVALRARAISAALDASGHQLGANDITAVLSAIASVTLDLAATLDAVAALPLTIDASLEAVARATLTSAASLETAGQASNEASALIDAIASLSLSIQSSLDAAAALPSTLNASLDVLARAALTTTTSLEAAGLAGNEATALLDAIAAISALSLSIQSSLDSIASIHIEQIATLDSAGQKRLFVDAALDAVAGGVLPSGDHIVTVRHRGRITTVGDGARVVP